MKNIIIKLTLSIMLIFGCLQVEASEIQLRIPDSTGIIGNSIDMPVYIDNSLTGQDVYAYEL